MPVNIFFFFCDPELFQVIKFKCKDLDGKNEEGAPIYL